jgi:2-C-methyl-D-erythritol 4-phosphate cytidylyltransferase/2-C-methyl-D-erythritol 2,4-cyclodiphosphate synthase
LSPSDALPADVVVVAAGSSQRMAGLDKLEAPLGGRPLLAWAIEPFAASAEVGRIVLVTSPERVERYRSAPWLPSRVSAVVAGGARRQESVAAGIRWLAAAGPDPVPPERVILVHDGARPAVSPDLIHRVIDAATAKGAAIPVVPVHETIKELAGDIVGRTIDRSRLGAAQTPQAVRFGLLEQAYARFAPESTETWTDEAALLEACTITVHAIPGETGNLKVTIPGDLARAEQALGLSASIVAGRVGYGSDTHPFGPNRPLALGGLLFVDAPRLHGHSDGDVVLHAVADALLGAAAMGDLGRLFPADKSTPAGIASGELLRAVVRQLEAADLRTRSVDVTIVGARPVLGARLEEMRRSIASLVGLELSTVSVKASSGNLSGVEGAGRAISAHVVAVVGPLDGPR